MARTLDRMESTLLNVAMKPRRLSVNVDQPIVLARNDNNWHPEVAVSFAQRKCSRNHQGRFGSASADLRWTHSHLRRKAFELFRHPCWTEYFVGLLNCTARQSSGRGRFPVFLLHVICFRLSSGPGASRCGAGLEPELRNHLWAV